MCCYPCSSVKCFLSWHLSGVTAGREVTQVSACLSSRWMWRLHRQLSLVPSWQAGWPHNYQMFVFTLTDILYILISRLRLLLRLTSAYVHSATPMLGRLGRKADTSGCCQSGAALLRARPDLGGGWPSVVC